MEQPFYRRFYEKRNKEMDRRRARAYLGNSRAKNEGEWGVMASISSRRISQIRVFRSCSLGRGLNGMVVVDTGVNHRRNKRSSSPWRMDPPITLTGTQEPRLAGERCLQPACPTPAHQTQPVQADKQCGKITSIWPSAREIS